MNRRAHEIDEPSERGDGEQTDGREIGTESREVSLGGPVSKELLEVLHSNLDVIDRALARQEVPVDERPLRACSIFVEECIVDMEGGCTAEYWKQDWFDLLWDAAAAWYRNRYGAALQVGRPETNPGLVIILGVPIRVAIPLTFWTDRSEEEGWIHMPVELQPNEDPFSWLESPPNLTHLSNRERGELRSQLTEVVRLTRTLHVAGFTAAGGDAKQVALRNTAPAHLAKAITDIASGHRGSAVWELHLAMEKALKAYLLQQTGRAQEIHNLRKLYAAALSAGLPPLVPALGDSLPDGKEAIQHRYGEIAIPPLGSLFARYLDAASATLHCVLNLKRTIVVQTFALRLRFPRARHFRGE